jgi:hypothetical protein
MGARRTVSRGIGMLGALLTLALWWTVTPPAAVHAQQTTCADYTSQREALEAYRSNPTAHANLDTPDRDTGAPDGIACEGNPFHR